MQITPLEKFFFWTDEEIEAFPSLPHPQNVLEMIAEQETEFKFTRCDLYKFDIRPRYPGAPVVKRVIALRCWLTPEYRWVGANWVDITATKLVSQLYPLLTQLDLAKSIFRIKKVGEPPKAEFSISYKIIE